MKDGEDAASKDASFAHSIWNDKEGLPKVLGVLNGTASMILDKVQALLLTWEKKYHILWDQDKDAFIRYEAHICHIDDVHNLTSGIAYVLSMICVDPPSHFVTGIILLLNITIYIQPF